jgi:hypothetical protein
MLAFYFAAVAISFKGYREFKGMLEDSNNRSGFTSPFQYGSVKDKN